MRKFKFLFLFLLLSVFTFAQDGCEKDDCDHQYGVKISNGIKYSGFFIDGKEDGPGSAEFGNSKLLSFWSKGKNIGFGFLMSGADSQQGYFESLFLEGRGIQTKDSKWQYGNFSKSKLLGSPYEYKNNNLKTGCTKGDCTKNFGTYIYNNGGVFTGFFTNSKPQSGMFEPTKGIFYIGEFNSEGKPHGIGMLYFPNQDTYFGNIRNGLRNGLGWYETKTESVQGVWLNDQLIKNMGLQKKTPPEFQASPKILAQNKTAMSGPPLSNSSPVKTIAPSTQTPKRDLSPTEITAAIAKIYPGHTSKNQKYISKIIEADANKLGSEEAKAKYIAEKIQEIYVLDKKTAYNAVAWIDPISLAKRAIMLLDPEQRNYITDEAKRITAEYRKIHPGFGK